MTDFVLIDTSRLVEHQDMAKLRPTITLRSCYIQYKTAIRIYRLVDVSSVYTRTIITCKTVDGKKTKWPNPEVVLFDQIKLHFGLVLSQMYRNIRFNSQIKIYADILEIRN